LARLRKRDGLARSARAISDYLVQAVMAIQ
jgi:hypothetical protein